MLVRQDGEAGFPGPWVPSVGSTRDRSGPASLTGWMATRLVVGFWYCFRVPPWVLGGSGLWLD